MHTPCCQVPSYSVHRADDGAKKRLVVEVALPGITSGADLVVSVREAGASLYVWAPGRYKLTVPLGVFVHGVAEAVKFARKKAVLKVGDAALRRGAFGQRAHCRIHDVDACGRNAGNFDRGRPAGRRGCHGRWHPAEKRNPGQCHASYRSSGAYWMGQ